MNLQQNVLSFTVNESLHMEAGQEIEEMLAISLEPDIAIETFDEYMQIRGLIILQGECSKAADQRNFANEEIDEQNEATVYMDKVIDTQVNEMMFSHRFPVEVSVARNRIENMADVKVEVVSFDYELPSNNRLNIQATLHIHGIKGEHAPAKKESKEEQDTNEDTLQTETTHDEPETKNDQGIGPEAEVKTDIKRVNEQAPTVDTPEPIQYDQDNISESIETNDDQAIDIQLSETAKEEQGEEVNDVLFLTDLFGDVEEASVTTMRIHIIQEEDTIESIAKRYDMSALKLMKDNQLHADDMEPGALIYISND